MALAQRIGLPALIETPATCASGAGFGGKLFLRDRVGCGEIRGGRRFAGWRRSKGLSQQDQQVVRQAVQEHAEAIGQAAMIAQPVRAQVTFQFLVAVLAFAAFRVFLVRALGQRRAPGRLVTTARRLVPLAFASHFTTTHRGEGHVEAW